MGDVEVGKCEVCGEVNKSLDRKYYHYIIDCDCCGGNTHFHSIKHCKDCEPKEPTYVKCSFKADKLIKPEEEV